MAKKKRGFPRFELLVILVFFISFLLWVTKRCSDNRRQYALEEQALQQERDSLRRLDSLKNLPKPEAAEEVATLPRTSRLRENYTTLFVTMEGLNMRHQPNLKSEVVIQLELFEEVYFLNEVTEFKDSINLGRKIAYEPWVKVQTKKGKSGWVFGAGVHYYKTKLEGVR